MRQTAARCVVTFLILAPTTVTPASSEGYSTAEAMNLVRSLGESLDMPNEKVDDLVRNFRSVSGDSRYTALLAGRPVSAVFVYRSTEAGLIYKRRSGHGTIAFKNTSDQVPLRLSGSSFGASIGGSAEWGIGLVLGLKENRHFGGNYEGDEMGATAADSTVPSVACFSNAAYVEAGNAHEVLIIVTARGLSAGLSKGKITLTPEW
jgi:hypothetical protein